MHHLGTDCVLDFSGRDVTIAGDGILGVTSSSRYGEGAYLEISARNLTVFGTIRATGFIQINTTEGVTSSAGGGGRGVIEARGNLVDGYASVGISAGGDVVLAGSRVSADAVAVYGEGDVGIEGANVDVSSDVIARGYEGASIDIGASSGSVETTGRLFVRSNVDAPGYVAMGAADDITMGGPIIGGRRTSVEVYLDASRDLHILAPIRVNTSNFERSGTVSLSASRDISVDADVEARGFGPTADGGAVDVYSRSGSASLNRRIDARGTGYNFDSAITLQAPSLTVSGELTTGRIWITYGSGLDVTGATLVAERYGNTIFCGCVDSDCNYVCDGGCSSPPSGLDQATVSPSAVITPRTFGECTP